VSGDTSPLAELLARRIRAEGPLTIAEYMAEALSHPRHGYYATRDPLGAKGDFITAPELSQVFGELVGLWCAELWQRMGAPNPVILAEIGPGRGTLMADALRAARVVPGFRRALRLHLVETSPVLRAAQAQRLGGAPQWHHHVVDLPPGPLLLVANEFLDALPIRQFERRADGWHERRVGLAPEGGRLAFVLDPAPAPEALLPPGTRSAPLGSLCEIRPAALALAAMLGQRLAREQGAALFIDYGYWPSACGDTLQAVRRHRRHAVLSEPGSADITAHVDFESFAKAAAEAGARVHGPVPQGAFLGALGLGTRAEALMRNATPEQAADIAGACRRLIEPAEMGTLFKVLALAHPALPAPAGFPSELPRSNTAPPHDQP
jgi:NADH dehydrogenase [ubiquinone] 1 alpha subcomplex assembly factor 7